MNTLVTIGTPSSVKDFVGPRGIVFAPIAPKRPPHRPSEMTSEVVKKLEDAFAIDASVTEACLYAGISRQTYYNWINANEGLMDRFEQLRETVPLRARKAIAAGVDQSFDNAFRYMVKKRPDEYGDRSKIELSGDVTQKTALSPEVAKVVEEMNAKLREAIAAPHRQ